MILADFARDENWLVHGREKQIEPVPPLILDTGNHFVGN